MNRRNMRLQPYVPPYDGKCKRGCCWTPFGCGKQKICECHPITFNKWLSEFKKEPGNDY